MPRYEEPQPPDQSWFWTDEWQANEHEVDEHLARGEVRTFGRAEEFLRSLEERTDD